MSETQRGLSPAAARQSSSEAGTPPVTPARTTRVAVVDDQPEFLSWVCRELTGAAGFSVVGHSLRPDCALATVRESKADLLLVDFDMPGMNGIQVIRQVREHAPAVQVVLMSLNGNRMLDSLARSAGAIGFLPKERFSPDAIRVLLDQHDA